MLYFRVLLISTEENMGPDGVDALCFFLMALVSSAAVCRMCQQSHVWLPEAIPSDKLYITHGKITIFVRENSLFLCPFSIEICKIYIYMIIYLHRIALYLCNPSFCSHLESWRVLKKRPCVNGNPISGVIFCVYVFGFSLVNSPEND